jgi:uncharacterized protein
MPDAFSHLVSTSPRTPGVRFEYDGIVERQPAFSTGVPVFVGFVEPGSESTLTKYGRPEWIALTKWDQREFARVVGAPIVGSYFSYAVRGFFENGGKRCVVVGVPANAGDVASLQATLHDLFQPNGSLQALDDVDLVCVPDLMISTLRESPEVVREVQHAILEYCWRMGDRFAIVDALPDFEALISNADRKSEASEAVAGNLKEIVSGDEIVVANGALYHPWLKVAKMEPSSGVRDIPSSARGRVDDTETVPPCGHIAGVYARTDEMFGFHKAPANEVLEGVVDLQQSISDTEQAALNDHGVNCIRSFAGRGIRVWGARTLSPQSHWWRYVNVRRLFLTFARRIEHSGRDFIFEPNDASLWAGIRQRMEAHCRVLYQQGALKGQTPEEAYFVKCDTETNPVEIRERGQAICVVGLAPLVPTEFVVVHVTQSTTGATVTLPLYS